MNTPTTNAITHLSATHESDDPPKPRYTRKQREAIYGIVGFVTGFLLLPALIFLVGDLLLGDYAGGKSMWAFYVEFYRNLIRGTLRTWFLALGPYLVFSTVRLSLRRIDWRWLKQFAKEQNQGTTDAPSVSQAPPPPPGNLHAQSPKGIHRREPFIGP